MIFPLKNSIFQAAMTPSLTSVQVTHILMQRCNPAHKQEKPEKGVVEGNVMLAGREPAGGHGHSHAIPAAVPADSGFEVSTFGFEA